MTILQCPKISVLLSATHLLLLHLQQIFTFWPNLGMVVSRKFVYTLLDAKAEVITWEVFCPIYFLEWKLKEDGEEGRENQSVNWLIFLYSEGASSAVLKWRVVSVPLPSEENNIRCCLSFRFPGSLSKMNRGRDGLASCRNPHWLLFPARQPVRSLLWKSQLWTASWHSYLTASSRGQDIWLRWEVHQLALLLEWAQRPGWLQMEVVADAINKSCAFCPTLQLHSTPQISN